MAHGEFGKWLESVSIDWSVANKMMKIVEEIGESYSDTYTNLGMNALYQIATLPPEERQSDSNFDTSRNIGLEALYEIATLPPAEREAEQKAKLRRLPKWGQNMRRRTK